MGPGNMVMRGSAVESVRVGEPARGGSHGEAQLGYDEDFGFVPSVMRSSWGDWKVLGRIMS